MPFNALRDARNFLLYDILPSDTAHFLRFVTDGEKDAQGHFVIDPGTGLPMTGVIDWVRANRLFDTRFYIHEKADGGLFFIATAVRTRPEPLPDWATIPGFVRLFGPNNQMTIRDDLNALVEP